MRCILERAGTAYPFSVPIYFFAADIRIIDHNIKLSQFSILSVNFSQKYLCAPERLCELLYKTEAVHCDMVLSMRVIFIAECLKSRTRCGHQTHISKVLRTDIVNVKSWLAIVYLLPKKHCLLRRSFFFRQR